MAARTSSPIRVSSRDLCAALGVRTGDAGARIGDAWAAPGWVASMSWIVDWGSPSEPLRGATLAFCTSGHTGAPRRWLRSGEQLVREAELLAGIGEVAASDGIVCFAPPIHLYGFLFSVAVPSLLRLPVWHVAADDWPGFAADVLPMRRPLIAALPAVVSLLGRERNALAQLEHVTVVHSTSALPPAATRLRESVPGLDLTELFGSTETGLIAYRRHDRHDPPWSLASDVEFASPPGRIGELTVRSPRLAREPAKRRPRTMVLPDWVEYVDGSSFRFLGRASRLVKVNGRRVNLEQIELLLRAALECDDLACLPRRDAVRGEAYELLVVPGAGPSLTRELRAAASRALAGLPEPREIRCVRELPRSATGKLRLHGAAAHA